MTFDPPAPTVPNKDVDVPTSSTSTNTESFPSLAPTSNEKRSLPYTSYVTHVLHLEGPGTPHVDKDQLGEMGIETLRLYGRKVFASVSSQSQNGGEDEVDHEVPVGMKYDSTGLIQALEVVLGKKGDGMLRGAVSRRNTLEPGRERGGRP